MFAQAKVNACDQHQSLEAYRASNRARSGYDSPPAVNGGAQFSMDRRVRTLTHLCHVTIGSNYSKLYNA